MTVEANPDKVHGWLIAVLDERFGGNQARMSKEAGINRPQLNDYINGKRTISRKMVLRIVTNLRVQPPPGMGITLPEKASSNEVTPNELKSQSSHNLSGTVNAIAAQLLRMEATLDVIQKDLAALRSRAIAHGRAS